MSEIYLGTPPPGVVSWCEKKYGPMTIEAISDGVNVSITYMAADAQTGTFQVQLNDNGWTTVSWETDIGRIKEFNLVSKAAAGKSSMSKGDKLRFKNIDKWSNSEYYYTELKITNSDAKVYGKLAESLTPEFAASAQEYKFLNMFRSSIGLKDASGLDLDGIALADYCYIYMFAECISLVNAPALPATTLANSCYNNMFNRCTSLVNAPKLPATTLADDCYNDMFYKCTKITELHYPASVESQIRAMDANAQFGATNAIAYFDL